VAIATVIITIIIIIISITECSTVTGIDIGNVLKKCWAIIKYTASTTVPATIVIIVIVIVIIMIMMEVVHRAISGTQTHINFMKLQTLAE
jgi:hypothetical protein